MAFDVELKLESTSGNNSFPSEYIDFIMMKEVYRCTPQEYDEIDHKIIELHKKFLNSERRAEKMAQRRASRPSKKR